MEELLMKKNRTKGILICLILLSIFIVVGCRRQTDPETPPPQEPPVAVDEGVDEELSEKIEEEEGVTGGRVYEQGDYIIGTMIIEKGVKQDKIDQIAEKYARELKDKYPNKKVNVQAVQDGKNVANITLD